MWWFLNINTYPRDICDDVRKARTVYLVFYDLLNSGTQRGWFPALQGFPGGLGNWSQDQWEATTKAFSKVIVIQLSNASFISWQWLYFSVCHFLCDEPVLGDSQLFFFPFSCWVEHVAFIIIQHGKNHRRSQASCRHQTRFTAQRKWN